MSKNNKDLQDVTKNEQYRDGDKPLGNKKKADDSTQNGKPEFDTQNIKTDVDEADYVSGANAEGQRNKVDTDFSENPSED
ncbi:MAG: hypothetical protein Q4B36_00240 [Tissierellia bacterium]|nr:hypothetical protein [Tissierellia bacterium]